MSMTVSDLQAQNGQATAVDVKDMGPKQQVRHLLNQNKAAIKAALPKHLDHERLLRVAQTAATSTPALLECHVPSLLGAVIQAATLGLEPNTVLGQAYLVPFNNRDKRRKDVQLIIGYKGLIDLARRSKQVRSIAAHVVRDGDFFEYEYGLDEKLRHIEADTDRGEITHVYAYAKLAEEGHAFEVMPIGKVREIMAKSQSKGQRGPWKDHFEEMARKTAIRRLAKFLPMSVDLAKASVLDERAETAEGQNLESVLDGEFDVMTEPAPEPSDTTDDRTAGDKFLDGGEEGK